MATDERAQQAIRDLMTVVLSIAGACWQVLGTDAVEAIARDITRIQKNMEDVE